MKSLALKKDLDYIYFIYEVYVLLKAVLGYISMQSDGGTYPQAFYSGVKTHKERDTFIFFF